MLDNLEPYLRGRSIRRDAEPEASSQPIATGLAQQLVHSIHGRHAELREPGPKPRLRFAARSADPKWGGCTGSEIGRPAVAVHADSITATTAGFLMLIS
jgi:hypothetical protein